MPLPRKPGKHTPYFELIDAQSQAGCPVCRLVHRATDRYLDSLLYEAVLDPEVRARLKESRGFCLEHVVMLKGKPGRALGIALIYRDILRTICETAERGRFKAGLLPFRVLLRRWQGSVGTAARLGATQPCPACTIANKAEQACIGLLLAHLEDDRLHRAYSEGEGLCLPHLILALKQVQDEEALRLLIQPQVARYRLMLHHLDEFIRKRDHRFREEQYGEEGDVWLRAMNAMTGGAGMGLSAKTGGRRSPEMDSERR